LAKKKVGQWRKKEKEEKNPKTKQSKQGRGLVV